MSEKLKKLVSENFYLGLQTQFDVVERNGWVVITTPFLDRHFDKIQIFMRPRMLPGVEGEWYISDDGHAMADWNPADISNQEGWINEILRAYSINIAPNKDSNSLFATAVETSICERIMDMLSVVMIFSNVPLLGSLPAAATPHPAYSN